MTLEQELNIRYEKGIAVGADSRNKELAKAFRDAGFPVEIISEKTGIPVAEIKSL